MSTMDPRGRERPAPTAISARYVSAEEPAPPKRRNGFIGLSAVLALALVAMIVWNVSLQSDLDDANAKVGDLQAQVQDLQGQIGEAKETGNAAAGEYRTAYEDLQAELGSTQADLADSQKQLEDAQAAAEQADKDAAAAKQQVTDAQTSADKAQAQADQARADTKAAEANATMVKDCGNAFLTQVDSVLKSDDPTAAAATAKQELQSIAGDCKAALGRT
jgi:chromosome segregation ATPase